MQENSRRLPCLDGWRAIFCGVVLLDHFHRIGDGQLGVRCFFVLSGFLITSLLLAEVERTSTVNVAMFMARRAIRLLPVYFVFLAVIAIFQYRGVVSIPASDWIAASTFVLNFVVELKNWTIFHLWSLSIEQQFYLAWPFLFLALAPWLHIRKLAIGFCGLIVFVVVFRMTSGAIHFWIKPAPDLGLVQWVFSPVSTFAFVDVLGLGCFAACIVFHYRERIQKMRRWLVYLLVVAAILLIVLSSYHFDVGALRFARFIAGYTIAAAGCAVLVAISVVHPGFLLFRMLNSWPFIFMGTISYSAYIWQQPFTNIWLQDYSPNLRLLAVLGIASLSYYLLERPFLWFRTALRPTI
ncbi:acyltransferase [uncultured Reyranella sp.]|uniref:acyltransferase family protein n=1 Tax=uncultured Reyranella sp. TaxID=735512 RepID=UPI00259CC83F|nr:acyltransferase [uncultured Reyranella sp.]